MSRSDRERRDAEKAARRAKRLADRAEQRARRQGDQARQASERAEELAERAYKRRRPRDRDRNKSIEDFVDDVAEKWSGKAEDWIDGQSRKLFTQDDPDATDADRGLNSAAKLARRQADTARRAADKAARRRSRRAKRSFGFGRWGHHGRRRRSYGLYRNNRNKKICGVCSGAAEYLGVETWQMRLCALFGLFFVPQIAVPAYFITYFLMDKKPYYREMTDRYDERHPEEEDVRRMHKRESENRDDQPTVSNLQALKTAKRKFSDVEDRLRTMESHVTSSQFELRRELRKISGDEA